MEAIVNVCENNVQKKDNKLMESLHLSTGTRTQFSHEILNFIIKHQSRENMFIDAVEFF
jgi:Zn finger protein HypA/HybF involved in hydrogenase expression